MKFLETIAYQIARGITAAVIEGIPSIRAALETKATDAKRPPETDAVNDALRDAIARGDVPGGG